MADLPAIEAAGLTAPTDRTRGAGAGERVAAAALGEVADTADAVTGLLINHQKGVDAAEVAKIKTAVDLDADTLAAQPELALDPEAFAKAWGAHRSSVLEKVPSRYAVQAGAYLDQIGMRKRGEIIGKAATAQTKAAEAALRERRGVLLGKLDAHAKQGPAGLTTEAYASDLAEYTEVETQLGNPNFGSSPAEAQGRLESSNTRLRTTATLVTAELVYKSEGLAAAKAFVEGVINDPSLRLSQADREAIANEAKQAVNLIHQADVEAAREAREQERDLRDAQRDVAADLRVDIMSGARFSAEELRELAKSGRIDDRDVPGLLRLSLSESRRAAAEARRDARLAEALANPLNRKMLERAAGGDREAARRAVRMVDQGLIDPEEAAEVAAEYAKAKKNPGYAAAMDFLSRTLSDDEDDRSGAIDHMRRQFSSGLVQPGREIDSARVVADKYRGRRASTLPAPMFGLGVPKTAADVAAAKSRLKALKDAPGSRITDEVYARELRNLAAWGYAVGAKK